MTNEELLDLAIRMRVLDLFGKELALHTRMKALTNQTEEAVSLDGLLLGGKFTITLTFDGTKR